MYCLALIIVLTLCLSIIYLAVIFRGQIYSLVITMATANVAALGRIPEIIMSIS